MNKLIIRIISESFFKNAKSYYHLHPDIKIKQSSKSIILYSKNYKATIHTKDKSFKVKQAFYYPSFGKKSKKYILEFLQIKDIEKVRMDFQKL